ncbi:hypothetical protein [Microbacterium sp. USHLN186]|uniref:hypothetical protein n=1 Tax=Microbacterium sp. USHLN186 TaxID=3081286 RepID=UPI00301A5483
MLAHVSFMVIGFALWVTYVATGDALWPWLAVIILCLGIPLGEVMRVRRSRRIRGTRTPRRADYGAAIGTVFAGRMPTARRLPRPVQRRCLLRLARRGDRVDNRRVTVRNAEGLRFR